MGFLSFISKLFGSVRHFNGTPEQYLAMVQYMAFKNNPKFTATELLQWGIAMQKVMKVDLSPFKDFHDLAVNGNADYSLVEKVSIKLEELEHRKDLKQALYGKNVNLGDDDVMKSDSKGAIYARQFVKDLSKHVRFSDGDQRLIDDL